MSRLDETIQAKKQKRVELEALGHNVHPYSYRKIHSLQTARNSMGEEVTTAGRIMAHRAHGKVTFLTLQDSTGQMQVMVKEETVGAASYDLFRLIDASDFIGVAGTVITTKTGEITIDAREVTVLSKALRAIPNNWQGIEDKEVRFRKRYLDLLINPDVKRVLDARWLIEREIRRYLQDVHNFVEVETPVLQPLYGGTNARPFTTHMNSLDSDFYLRIAPELYLKRLIVGGYERLFEIARNFRNEGIDQTHQPEFTMIEWYHAYADYQTMMDVAEGMFKHLCEKLYGKLSVMVGGMDVDLSGNWPRIRMVDALRLHEKIDVESIDDHALEHLVKDKGLELTGSFTRGKAIFVLFDKLVTDKLLNPTWIIDYPKDVSPLAKQHRSTEGFVERFELYVGGKEMADGWSEITDALEQRARFENEQKNLREGDAEAQPTDEDFLEAMEYGMPPLGGIGIGIDRLVMFLTNTWSIREVIAFPTLRPTPQQLQTSLLMQGANKKANATNSIAASGIYRSSTYGIEPRVLERFPGMFFAFTIIRGVAIEKKNSELESKKDEVYTSRKGITVEEITQLTPIAEYRKLFKETGVELHKMRPSPEALLRRIALDKGLYTINTAVDAYNLAVIETGVGLGGFNLAKLTEPVVLRFSKQGEQMHLLGDDEKTTLRDDQLVYADAVQPITIDLNYRDISDTKITEKTSDVILFADGAPGLTQKEVVAALQKGAEYIKEYCGGTIDPIKVISQPGETIDSTGTTEDVVSSDPLTQEVAIAMLEDMVENPGLRGHMKAMQIQMRGLWEYFSQERPEQVVETQDTWGLVGLLHDADWERTESSPDQHTLVLTERLKEMGVSDTFADAIRTHNFDMLSDQRHPETLMEWSLYASDHLSGIIIACALVMPEKKLSTVTPERVLKKFKEKSFAKGATREEILEGLTHLDIELETLVKVCLTALQQHSQDLGM